MDHGGAWVAQLVKRLTSAQMVILQFMSSSPTSVSVLTAQSLEPGARLYVSLSLCPSPTCALALSLSLSLSKLNLKKHFKKRKKKRKWIMIIIISFFNLQKRKPKLRNKVTESVASQLYVSLVPGPTYSDNQLSDFQLHHKDLK